MIEQPVFAKIFPVIKPFEICAGLAEKLHFHLLEFPDSKDKITRSNFVTERFTYLTYAERYLAASGTLNIKEVYKNALRRFGTKIYGRSAVLRYALKGFKHKVKLFDSGKVTVAAIRAGNFVFYDKLFELFV